MKISSLPQNLSFFFFYSILRWSVAVSTMRRRSSRITAFLQADAKPMFCWPRSASTALSQVWLGLPNGRFQSGGSPRITAATARWWSSCGELGAICPKSRKRLSVTRWERGWHPVVALTSTFVTWRVSLGSCVVPKCQMHQCESTGALGCIKSGPGDLDVFKSFNLSKIFSLDKFKSGQGYLVVFDGSLL